MVFKATRRANPLCFLITIFGIVAMGHCRTDKSLYAGKTVKTEYGDVYDCVDFYKQPAFDHPLLKNHSFYPEMRPTFQPKRTRNGVDSWKTNAIPADIIQFKDGGCPRGTVPIRRMNKESGISGTKMHPQRPSETTNPNAKYEDISGAIIAISQTKGGLSKVYNGVGAVVSIYKPRVLPTQYSSLEIIIKSGPDSLTVGWTVNPNKYQDNRTRLFIYSVAGDTHCFNSECGYISVRSDIPLDVLLAPVSERGGLIYENKFFIYRDQASGVWWLQIGMDTMKDQPFTLGFRPQKFFTALQSPATYAACGGEVYWLDLGTKSMRAIIKPCRRNARAIVLRLSALVLDNTRVNGRVVSPQVHESQSKSEPKNLNEVHMKTIKTQNGDEYDCVDFYEQPAFKHPLLRNHTFHPKVTPSITPKSMNGEAKTKNTKESFYGLEVEGCPFGTVPIRRHTKEQHDRVIKLSREQTLSSFTPNDTPQNSPGHHFAIVQSITNPQTSNYYGVGARLSILHPRVEDDQYSSAQCMIKNGRDSIKFGWTVNPIYYHDKQTRTFIRTEVGDTQCYNTDCSGFIIVRTDLPLDAVLPHYSDSTNQVTITMSVFRDPQSGNWWLMTGPDQTNVGFWPSEVMSELVECGGEAYGLSGNPEMGTGRLPIGNIYFDACVEKFGFVNEKFELVPIAVEDTEKFVTNDKYSVKDLGMIKHSGHQFLYGGPYPF